MPASITGIVAVLLFTAFTKILTTLNILRLAAGLKGGVFGVMITTLALALSLLVMSPQIGAAGGLDAFLTASDSTSVEKRFGPFMEKHTQPDIRDRFSKAAEKLAAPSAPEHAAKSSSFAVLAAAFIVSQLKEAFQLGLALLLPFLVIDLLVVNVLMTLGITQMPAAVVAFPFKLLLFFAVDGWTLISEKLIQGYIGG